MKNTEPGVGIERTFMFLMFLLLNINVFSQWDLILSRDSINVYNKPVSKRLYHYKAETVFTVPLDTLYKFFVNFNLYNQWIGYCEKAKLISSETDSLYTVYFLFDMPWPISDRDALIDFIINWNNYSGAINIASQESEWIYDKPLGAIRIKDFNVSFDLFALAGNKTKFVMQGVYRPNGLLPSFLVGKMLKWGPYDTLLRIKALIE